MPFKKTSRLLCLLIAINFNAHADLNIFHNEGSAPISKFGLKVVSLNNVICYEKDNVSEFTPRVSITEETLTKCDANTQYRVYGLIKGWFYGHTVFYGDQFVSSNGECTVSHEKNGYFNTKLRIKCESAS
jgi:hypothetical protein